MREFLYVDDMAAACVHVMQLDSETRGLRRSKPKINESSAWKSISTICDASSGRIALKRFAASAIVWKAKNEQHAPPADGVTRRDSALLSAD
jgi:hypothetical protein